MSDAADIKTLIDNADPCLLPLGVAKLLVQHGYRLPGVAADEQVRLICEAVDPALHYEGEDVNDFAARLAVAAGVTRS